MCANLCFRAPEVQQLVNRRPMVIIEQTVEFNKPTDALIESHPMKTRRGRPKYNDNGNNDHRAAALRERKPSQNKSYYRMRR